ncbi:MAG: hypothetical protein PHO36_16440 [Parabacteroides sp.]|nr:hypothetical protein [Parabacteroides sp.]
MKKLLISLLFVLCFKLCYTQEVNNLIHSINEYAGSYPVEKIYLHLDKPYYAEGEIIYLRAYLTNMHLKKDIEGSRIIYVELTDEKKHTVRRIVLNSDNNEFAGQIELPDSLPPANYHLRAYTNWMRNAGEEYFYHRDIPVGSSASRAMNTSTDSDFQVTFFPEGGVLLKGMENRVAFKVLGNDGFGKDARGIVRDDTGKELLQFQSEHLGMGSFVFLPEQNRTYTASVESGGKTKSFRLPLSEEGLTVSATQSADSICLVIRSTNIQPEQISIIGQSRHSVCYALDGVRRNEKEEVVIPKNKFPTGIAQFTLFKEGKPVSERLIFIDRKDDLKIEMVPDKNEYGDREKIRLAMKVTDETGKPVEGSFSLSVTDDKVVSPSIDVHNIKGSLLLEADLKGYIENAGWYFAGNEAERMEALDLLLSTQGWRRFSWQKIASTQPKPVYPVEKEFQLTGKLINMLGKPIKEGSVILFSNNKSMIPDAAKTDAGGRFGFIGFDCPDTAFFVLQGRNKRNNRTFLDVKIDSTDNHAQLNIIPLSPVSNSVILPLSYIKQVGQYGKFEKSMWTINLPDVEIKGKKMEAEKEDKIRQGMFSYKVGRNELNNKMSLKHELNRLPFNRLPGRNGIWIVDGVETDMESIKDMLEAPALYIESIELVSFAGMSLWGARGAHGGVIIKTRNPMDIIQSLAVTPPGLVSYKPEGYCLRKEFYVPAYDNPKIKGSSIPDLRTTIYWNPVVKTDSEGKATVEFYSADAVTTYSYVIEGMGENRIGYAR